MELDLLISNRLIEVFRKFEPLIFEMALVIKYYVQFVFLFVHAVHRISQSTLHDQNIFTLAAVFFR